MTLSPGQWDRIFEFQRREIAVLVEDRSEAERRSHLPAYARIGDWLPGGGGRVLELGCGPGRFVAMLAQLGYEVVGIDPVPDENWAVLRQRLPVTMLDGIRAEDLPFPDRHFDHVACLGAFLYFEAPERALAEIRRVMNPGGRLVLRNVNRRNLYTAVTGRKIDRASRNLYTEQELRELLARSEFRVERSFSYGFWPPVATMYWWYLVNGVLPQAAQAVLSLLTPRRYRINITVFATCT